MFRHLVRVCFDAENVKAISGLRDIRQRVPAELVNKRANFHQKVA